MEVGRIGGWKVGTLSAVFSTSARVVHVAGRIDRFDGPEKPACGRFWGFLGEMVCVGGFLVFLGLSKQSGLADKRATLTL